MPRLLHKPNLLRLYRAGVLVALAALIHVQARWFEAQRGTSISVRVARKYFPNAARVQLRDPERGLNYVVDARGDTLGLLLTTSPQTDNIIGYSGPNDVLIALDKGGAVAGLELLRSGDTPEHAEKVGRDTNFFRALLGWKPNEAPVPKINGVAGATLTSYAVAEAVQQRLAGASPSLRFPEPLTLTDARMVFTNSAQLAPDGRKFRVLNGSRQLLGYLLRTSPQADNVSGGYRGPTEALIALAPDGRTVIAVRVRSSYDTTSYVDQVRNDDFFLKLFQGRTLEQLAAMDFKQEKIEGVSGATQTSFALAEGLKRRAAVELKSRPGPAVWPLRPRDWGLIAVIAGAFVMAFTPLRGQRAMRIGWQLLLVAYVGVVNSDLLSLSLLGGWSAGGEAWKAAPALALLATSAFLVPMFTRRQIYCHQICPHGAAQELLGSWRRKTHASATLIFASGGHSTDTRANWSRWLALLPVALLAFALIAILCGLQFDLADLEPFDAWSWRAAGWTTITIAVAGLVASIFIPQAYCRYGCPTGALLGFIRSTGSGDHWSRRDWTALGFVALAFLAVGVTRARPRSEPAPEVASFSGRTMGTTWTVKLRDEVADAPALASALSNKFEWCEQMTSHWRTNTELSQFNHSEETNAAFVPWPVLMLARQSQEISRASDGAFDITVGPLVQLWGFGPPPRRTNAPTDAQINALLPAVGWQKLELLDGALRKRHPALGLDLSAIAPGWAIDQIAELLTLRGYTNFLVESGGELRARGEWRVAIEHPAREVMLRDESIGTSGTYRQKRASDGREVSHLIDPRTGRPITHDTVSVSVLHTNCARADAWAAALNVMGIEHGLPLAERLGLRAQFVTGKESGRLQVRTSSRWATNAVAQ